MKNVSEIRGNDIQARLAQSVERETLNLNVVGSSPTLGVDEHFFLLPDDPNQFICLFIQRPFFTRVNVDVLYDD